MDEDAEFDELVPAPVAKELLPLKPVEDDEELVGLLWACDVAVPVKPDVVLLRLCTDDDDEDERFAVFELELVDEDCLVACEDLRCFDVDDDDDRFVVVILMLVAEVDNAVVLMVESISFSGEEPESDEVSWAMGLYGGMVFTLPPFFSLL